ncbi:lipid-A-disaccharide synthase N-terminal domain-containing protein [Joostella atrarenae]|uniref:Lipid-A-disaccharide synthase N-terminal domain-containing protein n=1 Tax=Joostella atrarenae TaxID=679257 RepID=A0ABS9J3N3_9FLAO|nr:lipid-A-disaccharide synthase N-terminal domain-containing protein [Joostella atrarenae]MCF8715046.1 lipid-A-disaccharide synthase N-terminal domain-containing protein [Joostella atrarenae]
MANWIIYSIGFLAQILFSGRLIYQWLASEKSKKVLTPSLFWKLSLFASFLLFVYGWLRDDFAIMLGQMLTYFIYIRNLQLQGEWQKAPKLLRIFLLIFPILIIVYGYNNNAYDVDDLFKNEDIPFWLLTLGIVAQVLFTFRFIYQWIYSEKRKESSLPAGFWLLSLVGALLILSYAIFRKDPVLLVGHSLGTIIYARNLFILKKQND